MSGYTRQQSYIDGDVILAEHTNDEFDALAEAFSTTLGHKHDGTTAEGPTIDIISDNDGDTRITVEATADEDTIHFFTAAAERLTIANTGNITFLNDAFFNAPTTHSLLTTFNGEVRFNSDPVTFNVLPAFNGGASGISAPFTVDSTFLVTNLNADLLDGQQGSFYTTGTNITAASTTARGTVELATSAETITGTDTTRAVTPSGLAATYTAADVLTKIKTVDGAASGLDADLLDGVQGSDYARLSTANTFTGGDISITSAGGQFIAPSSDGVTSPGYTWGGQSADTGMYLITDAQIGIATNGTNAISFTNSEVNLGGARNLTTTTGLIRVNGSNSNGDALTPHYSFNLDTDTGMYRDNINRLGFSTNGLQRMLIGADGSIMIGATITPLGRLHVKTADSGAGVSASADELVVEGSADAGISILSGSASAGNIFFGDSVSGTIGRIAYDHSGDFMRFYTNNAEAARISNNGTFFVGKTVTDLTTDGFVLGSDNLLRISQTSGIALAANRNTTDGSLCQFYRSGVSVGTISVTTTTTSYNTTSDYRLKDNVVSLDGAIDRVKLLKPSRFNFIVDPNKIFDGFIAHEVQEIVPEAVIGEKDGEEMQQLDASKLVPLLTAALKEAVDRIEALEERITILENN